MSHVRVAVIGEYDRGVTAHIANAPALELAAALAGTKAKAEWVRTDEVGAAAASLAGFDAIWVAPNSPYASTEGALAAIAFARTTRVPFLGTCGGFQHVLLEYARNVLGLRDAEHEELAPGSAFAFVSRLSCSLVEASDVIRVLPGTRAHALIGRDRIEEEYHCNFGLNPEHRRLLEGGALVVSGVDDAGEVRIVELPSHPFFMATLFQPERSGLAERAHPLITGWLRTAARMKAVSSE